ncbi:alpha-(1-_6)-mannopyranosyltransferase A, partial [Mycobacterium sp. ITM-2017-0098]
GAHGMYSWAHVLLSFVCAAGTWYWLYRRAGVSSPAPERDEPPHEPDASAARQQDAR